MPFIARLTQVRDQVASAALSRLGPAYDLDQLAEDELARRLDAVSSWYPTLRRLDAWTIA